MNPCDECRDKILRYLDHDLQGHELIDFRNHLNICAECRASLEAEQALSNLLHSSRPLYLAPAALRSRVAAAVMQQSESKPAHIWTKSTVLTSFSDACRSDNTSIPKTSVRSNIVALEKGVGPDLRHELLQLPQGTLTEAERMSAIGRMACSISHDLRHSLTAIYANAEFLERDDICAGSRADLLLEIQEAVLAMTERIDSLLQFGRNGQKNPMVRERVCVIVEKAIAAVRVHPSGKNVSITFGKSSSAEAEIDTTSLESAIYNLLLNACQAATQWTRLPKVEVHLTDVDERIYVTILDNGRGIPASVLRTLFDPFVTAGKLNGTGLGLTLARRIAEEHGGSICLEESNREKTVFTLSLPKSRSLPLEDPKSGRAGSAARGNGFESCS